MHQIYFAFAALTLTGCLLDAPSRPAEPQAPRQAAPVDTCQAPACYGDPEPRAPLATLLPMQFQGKEIPEEEFRALVRKSFQAELDAQDQIVRDTKAGEWFSRSAVTEQEMFARWLRSLGVAVFPFREPKGRQSRPGS